MSDDKCCICFNQSNEVEFCEKINSGCGKFYCLECKNKILKSRLENRCPFCRKEWSIPNDNESYDSSFVDSDYDLFIGSDSYSDDLFIGSDSYSDIEEIVFNNEIFNIFLTQTDNNIVESLSLYNEYLEDN